MFSAKTQRGTFFYLRGCANPASWLPLAAGTIFTQPLREKKKSQFPSKSQRFDTEGDKANGGLKNTRARSTPSASNANLHSAAAVPNFNDDRPDMMATTTFTGGGPVDDDDRMGYGGGKIRRSNSRQGA